MAGRCRQRRARPRRRCTCRRPTATTRSTTAAAGAAGSKLPAISLGLWQNFGDDRPLRPAARSSAARSTSAITHFDLANNYGPPYGSAEINFGRIFAEDFRPPTRRARDLDQGRLGHVARAVRRSGRASTCWAASTRACGGCGWTTSTSSTRTGSIRTRRSRRRWARSTPPSAQGKARYVGISSYGPQRTEEAVEILRELGTPLLIHQPSYSMFNRWIEDELLDVLEREGVGLHRVLAARAGAADRQVPDGSPRTRACAAATAFSERPVTRARTSSGCGR